MRVYAAYKQDGTILALAKIEENPTGGIACRPVPGDGRLVAEVAVPEQFADRPLSHLLKSLRVTEGPEGVRLTSK
ncbi:hypothetical protein [Streptomyces sp. NPDC002537]